METQTISSAAQGSTGSLFGFAQFPDEAVEPFTRLAARSLTAPVAAVFLRQTDELILRCGTGLPEALKTERHVPGFFAANQTIPPRILIDDVRTSALTSGSATLERYAWQSIAVLQFSLENGTSALLCVADVQPHRGAGDVPRRQRAGLHYDAHLVAGLGVANWALEAEGLCDARTTT